MWLILCSCCCIAVIILLCYFSSALLLSSVWCWIFRCHQMKWNEKQKKNIFEIFSSLSRVIFWSSFCLEQTTKLNESNRISNANERRRRRTVLLLFILLVRSHRVKSTTECHSNSNFFFCARACAYVSVCILWITRKTAFFSLQREKKNLSEHKRIERIDHRRGTERVERGQGRTFNGKMQLFQFFFFSPNQNTRKIIKSFLNKWKQKYPPPFWFIPFIRLVGRSIGSAQWASERMMQWGKNKIACQFQM